MNTNSEEIRKNKRNCICKNKEGGWYDFKMLLRKKTLKVVLDKRNYINSPTCPICNKLAEMTFFISFRLYRKTERTQFITLHSICAFKKPRFYFKKKFFNKLDKILDSFDYLAEV
ncbi:MAG: hypothetical protein ACFFCE_01640 [Promethearchaeota archaeon]